MWEMQRWKWIQQHPHLLDLKVLLLEHACCHWLMIITFNIMVIMSPSLEGEFLTPSCAVPELPE